MKILHYLSDFSLYSETFIYDLITNLEERGEENIILTDRRHLKKERPFGKVVILGEKKIRKRSRKNIFLRKAYDLISSKKIFSAIFWFMSNKIYSVPNKKKTLEVLKWEKPDVIYAHFGPNAVKINNFLEENNLNIPLVAHFHGTDLTSLPHLNNIYRKNLIKLKNNKKLVCLVNSHFLEKKMLALGFSKKQIRVVYNTFNPVFLKKEKKNFFKKGKIFKIVNVSRFINLKGHKYLIDAFAKLLKEYPKGRLTFIGEGENMEEMIDYSKSLGVFEKVDFKGRIPHEEIPRILQKCDVYVQPSIKDPKTCQEESFGVVLLEAIAAGLPVIVTNTGGMPEVVGKESNFSFIVNQKDSEDLFRKLNYLASEKYKFSSNKKYAKEILTKFSNEKFLNRVMKSLYKIKS